MNWLKPYFHLFNRDGSPYMRRWWLLERRVWLPLCARLHHIQSSDDGRHMHDHPSWSISLILRGSYTEVTPKRQAQWPGIDDDPHYQVRRVRRPGDIVFRRHATDRHFLELNTPDVWTLFILGPNGKNHWGFYTAEGKVPWEKYIADKERAA